VKHTAGLYTTGILATMEGNSEHFEALMQMLQRNHTCYHTTLTLVIIKLRHAVHSIVLLTQYCAGDKIEKNVMGWACGVYG